MSPTRFDFCEAMRRLCEDICERVEVFHHVEMDEIAVAFSQVRSKVTHGMQAKLTPMRFENGSLTMSREGKTWTVQRLFDGEREMLYILTFYLPRFQNQTFREKMVTVFHELYHISPDFDGDIRRFEGRCHVHTESEKQYDLHMAKLVDYYLTLNPPAELYDFLKHRFARLVELSGSVVGVQIPIPKLIPVQTHNTLTNPSRARQ